MNPEPLVSRTVRTPFRSKCDHCQDKCLTAEVHFLFDGKWYWYEISLNCPMCGEPSQATPMWIQAIDDAAWASRQSSVGHELSSFYESEDVPVELAFRAVNLKPPGA